MIQEYSREDGFLISTDKNRLDVDMIHAFLSTSSYWAINIPKTTVAQSIEGSLCFGVYDKDKQVGFARVISDYATIAYLGDVFVMEEYRGKGLSKWLMECITNYPALQGLRRWILLTKDAHRLYEQFGFTEIPTPQAYMERHTPAIYQ